MNSILIFLGDLVAKGINYFIVLCAVLEYFAYKYSNSKKKYINSEINKWEKESDLVFDENGEILDSYKNLNRVYTIFIAGISIFPLLGMLGTISSLLSLDMSNSDAINNAKESFFYALTSTFLGIVAAIGFKALNAAKLYDIEDVSQRLLKLIYDLRQESINEAKKSKNGWQI